MNLSPEQQTEDTISPFQDTTLEQLPESLQAAVSRAGWSALTPVQARAIPYLLAGRDVMAQARTGSGKTGAFLLPMLQHLDPNLDETQALVLVPTRELARQVWRDAQTLCGESGLRSVAVYGGVGYGPQNEALRQGAHIVIGTPGRVLDHLLKRTLSLKYLDILVFDEADRMLSMGFYPDMKRLQRHLPDRRLNASMFSATFPGYVMRTAWEFLHDPEFLTLSEDHVHVTDTEHLYYLVPGTGRERSLVRLIEVENPASAIIFCNTKRNVHFVTVVLQRFGYDADELSADLSQKERERVLARVRKGALRFLVATDVAARGLDIPELSHVIQYEPPEDIESYIHRAGRTGRAGATGVAITLANLIEKPIVDRIAKHYEIDMQARELPTDADVEAVVAERLIALLEARLRERDNVQSERSRRFLPLVQALAENDEGAEIFTMLLDDYYQQMLHAPLPQPDEAPSPSPEKKGKKRRRRRKRGRRKSQANPS